MSSFGWHNVFPFVLGDEPTEIELAYETLREAAGIGASDPTQSALAPVPDDPTVLQAFDEKHKVWIGLEDLAVKCDAIALGGTATFVEHALWECFPDTMDDSLEYWERLFFLPRAKTTVERRALVAAAFTRVVDATAPALNEELQKISSRLALDPLSSWDIATTSFRGKNFGPLLGSPGAFDAPYRIVNSISDDLFGQASQTPNFADSFVIRVRYTLADGETMIPPAISRAAIAQLVEAVPSWCGFDVYNLADDGVDGPGFYFDGGPDADGSDTGGPDADSFFDVTAFGET